MIPAAGEWNPEHKVDDCKYILYTMYHTVSHCVCSLEFEELT